MATVQKSSPKSPATTALQYIRTIYLSLGAIIGLICFVMGASGAIKLGLNIWFPVDGYYMYYSPYQNSPCDQPNVVYGGPEGKVVSSTPRTKEEIADCEVKLEESNKKSARNDFNRQLSESVALTLVGFPVWMLHFWLIQRDWKKRKEV
jgi:hypothetical protein